MKVNKRIDKLKQWTGEKLGGQQKTELSDDFQSLEQDVGLRKSGVEKMYSVSMEYSKYLSKKSEAEGTDTGKVLPQEGLGLVFSNHGEEFGYDSTFGQALNLFGKAEQQIASVTTSFIEQLNSGWLTSLEKSLAQMSEYTNQRKKLDSRRLSYDAMLAKVQKSKKEKRELEDDLRVAKNRYEETSAEVYERAIAIQESDSDQMIALTKFVEIQSTWIDNQKRILDNLKRNWPDLSTLKDTSSNGKTAHEFFAESHSGSKSCIKRNVGSVERRFYSRDLDDRQERDRENRNSDGGDYEEREEDHSPRRHTKSTSAAPVNHRLPPSPREIFIPTEKPSVNISNDRHVGVRLPGLPATDPRRSVPPPSAPQSKWMKAKWAYSTNQADELGFEIGDRIKVLNEINSEWLFGKNEATGQSGMFPAAYCIEEDPEPPKFTPRKYDTFADPDELDTADVTDSDRGEEDESSGTKSKMHRSVSSVKQQLGSSPSTRSVSYPGKPPSLMTSPNAPSNVGKRAPPPPPTRRATTASANPVPSSARRNDDQPETFGSVKDLKKRLGMTE